MYWYVLFKYTLCFKCIFIDFQIEEIKQCKNCYYMSNAKPKDWFCQPCVSIDWLIDWLTDWLIDWLIDCLIDWCLTPYWQYFNYITMDQFREWQIVGKEGLWPNIFEQVLEINIFSKNRFENNDFLKKVELWTIVFKSSCFIPPYSNLSSLWCFWIHPIFSRKRE